MEWKYECLPHQNLNELKYISKKETYKIYKFNDILIDETRKAKKIKKSDYLDEGSTPIFDQSKEFIAGYTNIEDGIYSRTPFILFGDHTRVFKYIKINGCLGADGAKIINLKEKYIDEINLKYIYYYFNHIIIPDTGYNRHFKYVKGLLIPVPSLAIQEQIVEVLDMAQELIDKRKAQIQAMDSLIESIFYSMFGDPVRNEKGWEIKRIDNLGKVGSSRRVYLSECVDEGIPFYRGQEISKLSYGKKPENELFITLEHYKKLKNQRGVPKKGDLLLPSICPDGDIWMVDTDEPFYFKDGRVLWIELEDENINHFFIKTSLAYVLKKNFAGISSGSTFSELKIFLLESITIPIPPLDLQNEFAQKVELIEREKEVLEESLELMEENYRSIMDRAFKDELFN